MLPDSYLSQVLGRLIEPNPPATGIILVCRQERHMICTDTAREASVEAPITIPGTRTSLPM